MQIWKSLLYSLINYEFIFGFFNSYALESISWIATEANELNWTILNAWNLIILNALCLYAAVWHKFDYIKSKLFS